MEKENAISAGQGKLKRINLSGDEEINIEDIPCAYHRGVKYVDLKKITFINNNGIANLIRYIKYFLENGIEVKFINLSDSIKYKIKMMGLTNVINL